MVFFHSSSNALALKPRDYFYSAPFFRKRFWEKKFDFSDCFRCWSSMLISLLKTCLFLRKKKTCLFAEKLQEEIKCHIENSQISID